MQKKLKMDFKWLFFLAIFISVQCYGFTSTHFSKTNDDYPIIYGFGSPNSRSADEIPLFVTSNKNGNEWIVTPTINGLSDDMRYNGYNSSRTISCTDTLCLATGFTSDDASVLFRSFDKGLSWSVIKDIPEMPKGFEPQDISCSNTNSCVMVGNYFLSPASRPVLLSTQDGGNTWSSIKTSDNFSKAGNLTNVYCSGKTCLATGNVGNSKLPFIVSSQDSGASWSEVKNIAGCSVNEGSHFIKSFNCTGNNCIAVGYISNNNYKPLILNSYDKGLSWTKMNFTNMPNNGFLSDVECDNESCFAVGNSNRPIIMVSNNAGNSWSAVNNISGIPAGYGTYVLGIHCEKNECMIVGNYSNQKYDSMPFTLISHDKGQSWTYASNISGLPVDNELYVANSFHCSNSLCTMIGDYAYNDDAEDFQPLLMTSRDHGQSWSVINTISGLPDLFNGSFTGIGG